MFYIVNIIFMIENLSFTLSNLVILLTLYGYGILIKNKRDIFFIFLSGYIIIGSIALIFHFFFSISNILSCFIIIIGISIIFFKKIVFKKEYFLFFFIIISISYILIGNSSHAIDANMYHHPYVAYLNSEKIIFGLANLHSRFGHISFLQYVQSIFVNDHLSEYSISSINIIFFITFILFCSKIIFNESENKVLFLVTIFIASFTLIKFGRYREFGNDLIPFLVSSYLLILIIQNKKLTIFKSKEIFYYFHFYIFFTLTHKISYVFSTLILFSILRLKNLAHLFKIKIIFVPTALTVAWLLKNYIETSCIIYHLLFYNYWGLFPWN